jgi:hypothetical protein
MTTTKHRQRPGARASAKRKGKKDKPDYRTAKTSDRHELYELSVQEPEAEVDLIEQVWKEQRGRECITVREDFCGTAAVCMEWVRRRRKRTAIGVDLDGPTLAWAASKMPARLTKEQAERIQLIQEDVLKVETPPIDTILAMNFSYYLFRKRSELLGYFKRVREALVDDGLFLLDAYGGSEAFIELEEDRELDGFTYVWDQHSYNPINGEAVNYIHFVFPDGSKIEQAFEYHWRLWTLAEIQDLLHEAGFREVVVYWEGTDEETEEGDGNWEVTTVGEACAGWVAYLVGIK